MAEPNQGFMRQLRALEAAGVFARLHEEWSSTGSGCVDMTRTGSCRDWSLAP